MESLCVCWIFCCCCCIDRICQNQGMIFLLFWGVALVVLVLVICSSFHFFLYVCTMNALIWIDIIISVWFTVFFSSTFIPYLIMSWHHFIFIRKWYVCTKGKRHICDRITIKKTICTMNTPTISVQAPSAHSKFRGKKM